MPGACFSWRALLAACCLLIGLYERCERVVRLSVCVCAAVCVRVCESCQPICMHVRVESEDNFVCTQGARAQTQEQSLGK
jgi:hypothetical protein